MRKRKDKAIKFVGEGSYFVGIPARDLTMFEWEKLPLHKREMLLNSGLYVMPEEEVINDYSA